VANLPLADSPKIGPDRATCAYEARDFLRE
jgi:hypothetical protein